MGFNKTPHSDAFLFAFYIEFRETKTDDTYTEKFVMTYKAK